MSRNAPQPTLRLRQSGELPPRQKTWTACAPWEGLFRKRGNQVLVSFGDGELNREIIVAIQKDGTCWCGGTEWQGKPAMRISISCWATSEQDIDRSLAAIMKIARMWHSKSR